MAERHGRVFVVPDHLSNVRYLTRAMDKAGLPAAWRVGIYREADARKNGPFWIEEGWLSHQVCRLEQLARGHVPIDATSRDVRERAEVLAGEVAEAWRRDWSEDGDARLIVQREGEDWPGIDRATDRNWWRRRIARALNRRTEDAARDLGHVGGRGPAYVSEETHQRYLTAKRLSEAAIDSAWIDEINDGMQEPAFSLRDAVQSSVSNPTIRLAELITRARGMETVADESGHVGMFWTLTAGSSWHATRGDGSRNHRWNGSTVRGCADHLLASWKRALDSLRGRGISVYGVRIVEPHKDGTPHIHALTFCDPAHANRVKSVLYGEFLRDGEVMIPYTRAMSQRWRVKCDAIDKAKGTAISYLVKYLTKNLTDEHKLNAGNRGVSRVQAWASAHAIRQFQFVGGPSVTTWREARRMTKDQAMECEQFALAFDAVHRGDWRGELSGEGGDLLAERKADFAAFIKVQGGIACPRGMRPIQPFKDDQRRNKYGERVTRIVGVQCGFSVALTRERSFAVRWGAREGARRGSSLGLVSITSGRNSTGAIVRGPKRDFCQGHLAGVQSIALYSVSVTDTRLSGLEGTPGYCALFSTS